ncbi:hypothetical protein [Roseivirga pacifica]|uniref:hypothetical protein n=1 Tax=Roseivirga pacifica TaxID=1267423 RepID=UPI002094D65C|nr:hypothetical protein [Roseivirga pacifica]MCO6359488.1 hypothetical protein [Roseivirga pacifica]MCO6366858.1 hypothetical protein [Roseivirga pacifica]MCO6370610.1 hypothetical protein [Roseivirga pacifica]MCO6374514.1 hypothetical protein [Roseivirga pacifica]MCO6379773.1 hypothetical protein [Roseivirga pacifica]
MKVLFLENRYKTYFWELVASWLRQDGHEIYWIVQNHAFKPRNEVNCLVIPYPTAQEIEEVKNVEVSHRIVSSNRGLNYFDVKSPGFLHYYYGSIKAYIDEVSPNLVFGECTQFHEMITIDVCKKKGILFLHPSSCRYPRARFSFYQYDTLVPFSGEGAKKPSHEIIEVIDGIISGKSRPDYMFSTNSPSKFALLRDKVRLTIEYYKGERFNTPSPVRKYKLDKFKKKMIQAWELLAKKEVIDKSRFNILFPLQMQPEANIDVWGYPYSNQLEVVKKIVGAMGEGDVLYLKPNPKSKYELEPDLLKMAGLPQVEFLRHKSSTADIMPDIDLVITVTGTMTLECILSKKPVLSFGMSIIDDQLSYQLNTSFRTLEDDINSIRNGERAFANDDHLLLINFLYSTSFDGIIGDGLHNRVYLMNEANIENLKASFRCVIAELQD